VIAITKCLVLGADRARAHSCVDRLRGTFGQDQLNQRIEWAFMIAAISAAATNIVIAALVPSLVGLWVMTQLRTWRTAPRARG
jgi:hypothetical protein